MELYDYLEILAVITGLVGVYFSTRENILYWPLSMISVSAFIMIYWHIRLYADMGLMVFYFFTSMYGWYHWLQGAKGNQQLPISKIPMKELAFLMTTGAIGTLAFAYFLGYTDADIPYWDAFTTIFSLAGVWMMARKYLEVWILWFVIDAVYVGIYIYKEVFWTSGLYFIYVFLAVYGMFNWWKSYKAQQANDP